MINNVFVHTIIILSNLIKYSVYLRIALKFKADGAIKS
jgi:hypothetical protein